QWRVIRVLAETTTVDATDLAERACILAPSLTRIIRSLEERGIITRERDEIDARRLLLALTPDGFDIIRAVSPHSKEVYAELEARYGRERIEKLLDMLADLAALKLPE